MTTLELFVFEHHGSQYLHLKDWDEVLTRRYRITLKAALSQARARPGQASGFLLFLLDLGDIHCSVAPLYPVRDGFTYSADIVEDSLTIVRSKTQGLVVCAARRQDHQHGSNKQPWNHHCILLLSPKQDRSRHSSTCVSHAWAICTPDRTAASREVYE